MNGSLAASGALAATHIPVDGFYSAGLPRLSFPNLVRTLSLEAELRLRMATKGLVRGLMKGTGVLGVARLHATVYRADGSREHLGLLSTRFVTDTGVGFIVDAFQNLVELENMKYHGVGTGTNAENQTDSALQTESTTVLTVDSTRATGTTTEVAANQYRTVATVSFDGTAAITEHGVLSQAATGGGVLLDRSVFSAINVVSGDSIQFTYTLTFSAGG